MRHLFWGSGWLAMSLMMHAETAGETGSLEVHEWGTFTVVSGSDGRPLRWFQPATALAELPPFVGRAIPLFSKSGLPSTGSLMRMETPVIYFYPDRAMKVQVKVSLKDGYLTEWFPPPAKAADLLMQGDPRVAMGKETAWVGELRAANDETALLQIPPVPPGCGAHYAHARAVPQAWIFAGAIPKAAAAVIDDPRAPSNPVLPSASNVSPLRSEKFIFYRGVSDAPPPLEALVLEEQRLKMYRFDSGTKPVAAFALQVDGALGRWGRLADLPPRGTQSMSPAPFSEISLSAAEPTAQAAAHLNDAMVEALADAGLSEDEAKAMVATWNDAWFQEDGTRILAILPHEWVDSILPLTITPTPKKLTRVFVGRFELFTPKQEKTLLTLLSAKGGEGASSATTDAVGQFRALHLGRFAQAALQRVKTMQAQHAEQQFAELEKASAALQPVTAAR